MASMNVFRSGVKDLIAAAIPSIPFLDGYLDGPATGNDVGCLYPDRERPVSQWLAHEELVIHVRVFKVLLEQTDAHTPAIDPQPLEALVDTIKATIDANETAMGTIGVWFMTCGPVEYLMPLNGIDVTIVGRQDNRAASGG